MSWVLRNDFGSASTACLWTPFTNYLSCCGLQLKLKMLRLLVVVEVSCFDVCCLNLKYFVILGSAVSAETRLAITLRFFAGGAVLDLLQIYNVSESECYDSIRTCTVAINNAIPVQFPHDDIAELRRISEGFAKLSPEGLFKGCAGAVDGIVFMQKCPGVAVDQPAGRSFRRP